MASQDPDRDTGPPRAARNRRVHGPGDAVWSRSRGAGVSPGPDDATTAGDPREGQPPNTQPTQIIGPDWLAVSTASLDSPLDPTPTPRGGRPPLSTEPVWPSAAPDPGWSPDPLEDEELLGLESGPSLVRPYARTGGRTKPARDLDLEALVRTTVNGKEAVASPLLSPEHISVIDLCGGTVSVAEIAAQLAVPIGVARVIIADMVDLGLVEVMKTSAALGDERDPAFLRRVLSGLQRL